jgi:mono/diheme cytochrome c family protein
MSKRTFIWFGVLVLVLVVAIPFVAFRAKGDGDSGEKSLPASLKNSKELFVVNCGTCHALYSAGTDGNYGPDLDELLAPTGPPEEGETPEDKEAAEATVEQLKGRVLLAIEQGLDTETTPGRMPGGILNEEQAEQVSEFVARTAGEG